MSPSTKICPNCNEKFTSRHKARKYCSPNCKSRFYEKHHPGSAKAAVKRMLGRKSPNYRRAIWLKLQYGLTYPEFEAMLSAQNGLCAVCGKPETAKSKDGKTKFLSVDHDHKTGKVRGLLCNKCNQALGLILENPATAEGLAAYIRKFTI